MEQNKNDNTPPKKKRGNSNIGELGKETRFDKRPDFINKNGRPMSSAVRIKSIFEREGVAVESYTKETIAHETQLIFSLSGDQLSYLLENKKLLSLFGQTLLKCIATIQKTGKITDLQKAIEIAHPDYFQEPVVLSDPTALINSNADLSVLTPKELQDLYLMQKKIEAGKQSGTNNENEESEKQNSKFE